VDGILAVGYAAVSAIDTQASFTRAKIGMAILKQLQDQQKQMGEALVRMIQARPGPDQPGHNVDYLI